MLRRFRLEEPETVAEAAELLGRFGESAKLYAGGTELLLAMKEGLVQYERLVNVKNLKGLDDIACKTARSHRCIVHPSSVGSSAALRDKLPALVKLEQNVANVRVRQAGTIGGNLFSLSLTPIRVPC